MIVFVPMISLNDAFLGKAMTCVALTTFPNVLCVIDI